MIFCFLLVPAQVPGLVSLLFSGKGSCSIMISWFLLVPAQVPGLVSRLSFPFFFQEKDLVPSWFPGSFWFWLRFRGLSPYFSLLSFFRKGILFHHDFLFPSGSGSGSGACLPTFLRKGILFHHDFLVPSGSGSGSGACLPTFLSFLFPGKGPCSIMISWFLLVLAQVPGLVSLLFSSFFFQERDSVPSWFSVSFWFRLRFRGLSPYFSQERDPVPSWFPGSFWFRLRFRGLSPDFPFLSCSRKRTLFHHDFLVPSGSGSGSGACLPTFLFFLFSGKGFCSIMISWFLLVPAQVPGLVSLLLFFSWERDCVPAWFIGSFWFRLRFQSWFPGSFWFWLRSSGVCLPTFRVPGLVSLLFSSFLSQERDLVPSWFTGSCWFRQGFRGLSLLFSSSWFPGSLSQERDSVPSWFPGSCGSG